MLNNRGDDKLLAEMTESELDAIVAENTHAIRSRRYTNGAHLRYLQSRVDRCSDELNQRKVGV